MELGILTTAESYLLIAIFFFEAVIGLLLWKWLRALGRGDEDSLSSSQRIRCYFLVLFFLALLVLSVTVGGVLSHFDRPWYAVQNLPGGQWVFSPAHYYIFLGCYPCYIIFGAGIYILLRNWLPSLLLALKVPLVISVFVPFVFVPAVDGNLLDLNITLMETAYITFYWAANLLWIVFGILPIAYSILLRLMEDIGRS